MRWLMLCCVLTMSMLRGSFSAPKPPEPLIAPAWQRHASPHAKVKLDNGTVTITAPMNAYGHISAPLGSDFVTVSARITPSNPAAMTWCTSIFLIWDGGNWCQMGINSPPGGEAAFYTVETEEGVTKETYLNKCEFSPHYVRIQLGKDCVRYSSSEDGTKWNCLRMIERPARFAGGPTSLVAGKGYSKGVAPYDKPDLDNDYSDLGQIVTSKVSDIKLQPTHDLALVLTAAEKKAIAAGNLDRVGLEVLGKKGDPTYERVVGYYPAFRYPKEAVGVPEHPQDICIDHLGRLQRNYNEPLVAWFATGDPPVAFGDEKTPIERRLLNGYIPVLTLKTVRDGVAYEQTVFGWSQGFSADKELYAYVRLRATPTAEKWGSGAVPAKFSLVTPDPKLRMDFAAEKGEVCLRFPWPRPADAEQITPAEFEKTLQSTAKFWQAKVASGARFSVPDKRVMEAYRAWMAYQKLLVDKVNGVYEPHDGTGFYEENYGYSVLLHCMMLDQYGLHDRAQAYLESTLTFQQPDGLYTQQFGLADVGLLLHAISTHYNLTGDAKWLKKVAPKMALAGDWIIRQRKNAPKEGVTKGLIKFRPYCDYAEPEFDYLGDTNCVVGLEKAAAALKAIGMNQDAARFADEARAYRADIYASMDAAAIREKNRTILPLCPDTHRLLKQSGYTGGDYYGLVASSMLDSGFLAASDKRAYWVTDYMEQNKGLIAGLCRFGPGGVDHAYTNGYLMMQLDRGDIRKVLLGFWSYLAFGMTRNTYSPVECTTITTGGNAWTLPHAYSNTQQLRLLRSMLLREKGQTLRIGDAIPTAWLEDGKKIEVNAAPTQFGDVSYTITSSVKAGKIAMKLTPPTRIPPKSIHIMLRHPTSAPIKSVMLNGRKWTRFTKDSIELTGLTKPVTVEVRYR